MLCFMLLSTLLGAFFLFTQASSGPKLHISYPLKQDLGRS